MKKIITIFTMLCALFSAANAATYYFSRGYDPAAADIPQTVWDKNFSNQYNWMTTTGESGGGNGFNTAVLQGSIPGINDVVGLGCYSNQLYNGSKWVAASYMELDQSISVQGVAINSTHNKAAEIRSADNNTITLTRASTGNGRVIEKSGSGGLIFNVGVTVNTVDALANTIQASWEDVSTIMFNKGLTVAANLSGSTTALNFEAGTNGAHMGYLNVVMASVLNTGGAVNIYRTAANTNVANLELSGSVSNIIGGDVTIYNGASLKLNMSNNASALGTAAKTLYAYNGAIINYMGSNQLGSNVDFFVEGKGTYGNSLTVNLEGCSDNIGMIALVDTASKMLVDFGANNETAQTFWFDNFIVAGSYENAALLFENYEAGLDKIFVNSEISETLLSQITINGEKAFISQVAGESYYELTSIPEPATCALIFAAFTGLLVFARRCK